MTLDQILSDKAYVAGADAFEAGRKCTPCLDPACNKMIGERDGKALLILDSWLSGWTHANLNAPLTV